MSSITVSGKPGTGTTTLCKLLQEATNLPYTYAGQIFRAEAQARDLDLAEFGTLCQQDPSIDKALDEQQAKLLQGSDLILEGRLSGWLATRDNVEALRVSLTCDDHTRFERLANRDGSNANTQAVMSREREASELDRYNRYYGVNPNDTVYYDMVLDSTNESPESLVEQVLDAWRAFSQ